MSPRGIHGASDRAQVVRVLNTVEDHQQRRFVETIGREYQVLYLHVAGIANQRYHALMLPGGGLTIQIVT